jgi:N6-adenosine-specific RNA methylase IME4
MWNGGKMQLPAVPGGFGCIVADPPWRFETYDGVRATPTQGDDAYVTMTLAQLQALDVAGAAAKDCALIMWTLGSMADQAMALGAHWGFSFVRADLFVWIKERPLVQPMPGMGYWTRNGAEIAMLFKRGSPSPLSHDVDQVIYCRRGKHSAKPVEALERIERLVAGPYLELFARERRPGWAAWGDQIELTLFDA